MHSLDSARCATSTLLELEKCVFKTDVSKNMLFGACLPPEQQSSYAQQSQHKRSAMQEKEGLCLVDRFC